MGVPIWGEAPALRQHAANPSSDGVMMRSKLSPALPLLFASLVAGCSGVGTSMTRVGRMGQNQGFEIPAPEQTVQQAAADVLNGHGYNVTVKPDPENGAEGAGLIVIGQKETSYTGAAVEGASTGPSPQMNTRDLVDVYLSKKWQMGSDVAKPGVTLVQVVGGSYLRKDAGSNEVETPMDGPAADLLRDEIERRVTAIQADKAAVN
jgi:hypothetical protein